MAVRVQNTGSESIVLPPPFRGILKAGQAVVIPMTLADVKARFGPDVGPFRLREVADLSADPFPMGGLNIVTEPGTVKTIGPLDDYVRFTSASPIAVTLPASIPIGLAGILRQGGVGAFTLAGEAGVTVNAPFGKSLVSAGQRSMVTWIKVGALEYDITGDCA